MSTAAISSSSPGLPPPHRSKRPSPAAQPNTSPALSPELSPLVAPAQPIQPRRKKQAAATAISPTASPPLSPPQHPLPPPPPTTYFCYLLRSLSPRHPGHTYIGFTTDPLRRLRQHNGHITSGAHRTARRRPWQLVAAVSGFTSKVTALQFEWQWTYPRKSKRMRGVMEGRRWGGGVRGKVEVLYELLATQPWQSMPLQLRYAEEYGWGVHETVMKRSERERKDWDKVQARLVDEEERRLELMKRHIYALPTHMPLTVGPFEQLDAYEYRRMRRERRKGGVVAGGLADVTPGENGESDMEDGALEDEGAMVSGEESDNSGESDVEIIEQLELDDDDWTSYPLTQPAQPSNTAASSSASSSRLPTPSPLASSSLSRTLSTGQLRCGLCFRRSEVSEGGHGGFFSGCLQCSFVGHLTCIVQHIFKQMQVEESKADPHHNTDFLLTQSTTFHRSPPLSAHSPPIRSHSNPADLFTPSPAFPSTIFSPLPTNLPLLPPAATGTCPTCSCLLSYPLLIDRCRHLHVGRDGRQGGDVWYEEADELSMARMVREYAGRAGEAKAKEKEEESKRKKADGVEKRKRKVKATTQSGSGDESSCSTDTSQPGMKPKRKRATPKNKKAKASTTSPRAHIHSPPPLPLPTPPSELELDKENVGRVEERVADVSAKRQPTASRRVAMHDKPASAPALFASSQPAPASAAVSSSAAPSRLAVSLSDDDEVLLVDELPSADKRRLLMAAAAERRLGRSPTSDSTASSHDTPPAVSDVSLLAVRGSGGLHAAEMSSDVAADRDYVRIDDDSDGVGDDVLALDTEAEDEVSAMSLSERLKARAASAQLVDSLLQDIR